jgi:hypothetical protein
MKTRADATEFPQFYEIAEQAQGGGLFEAKALMATIRSEPEDSGEGEAALSLLSGFAPSVRARAILEELPWLVSEGEDDWCDSIVETEARFNFRELVAAADRSDPQALSALKTSLWRISSEDVAAGRPDIAAPVLWELSQE